VKKGSVLGYVKINITILYHFMKKSFFLLVLIISFTFIAAFSSLANEVSSSEIKPFENVCPLDYKFNDCLKSLSLMIASSSRKVTTKSPNFLIVGDSISVPDSFKLDGISYEKLAGNGRQLGFFLNAMASDIDFNFVKKIKEKHFDIVFIHLGSNDVLQFADWDDVSFRDLAYSNLQNYIEICLKNNIYPILSTVAFENDLTIEGKVTKADIFNDVILTLRRDYDIGIFNYTKLASQYPNNEVFKDIVHPTDKFNEIRGKALSDEIRKLS